MQHIKSLMSVRHTQKIRITPYDFWLFSKLKFSLKYLEWDEKESNEAANDNTENEICRLL